MSHYSTYAVTSEPTEGILHAALSILTNNGFTIVTRNESTACLTGPGLNSTRQNPLLGASKIQLVLQEDRICLDAELGGVDSMQRFLVRFPLILGLGLGMIFGVGGGVLFGQQFGIGFGVPWARGWSWMLFAVGTALLPIAPWLILAPLLAGAIRQRTQLALNTLVSNAVLMAVKART